MHWEFFPMEKFNYNSIYQNVSQSTVIFKMVSRQQIYSVKLTTCHNMYDSILETSTALYE